MSLLGADPTLSRVRFFLWERLPFAPRLIGRGGSICPGKQCRAIEHYFRPFDS